MQGAGSHPGSRFHSSTPLPNPMGSRLQGWIRPPKSPPTNPVVTTPFSAAHPAVTLPTCYAALDARGPLAVGVVEDLGAAQVGGEDDDGVFEGHHAPLAVGHAAVVQDLRVGRVSGARGRSGERARG